MEGRMRLLLVEDDRMLGEAVQLGLQQDGHAVDWVRDAEAGLAAALMHGYAALLLDLGLPRGDGLSLLRSLRAKGNAVPVLIVTARDAVATRIEGLDAGADDYLLKPFDLDELAARLRAVTRRHQGGAATPLLTVGAVQLDSAARRCLLDGRSVELTAREFMLLQLLMERAGRIVSKADLETALFDWGNEVESNVVEVYVSQLRRKLGRDFIRTRRGLGYAVGVPA
jgi:two-component system, OmpR family, response regulator QseB